MFESKTRILVVAAVCLFLLTSSRAGAQFPASLDPSDFDGTSGFTVEGYLTREFAWFVAGIGDVNDDGNADVAGGGPGVSFPPPDCGVFPGECPDCDATPGAVYVLFGRSDIAGTGSWNLKDLDGDSGFRVEGLFPSGEAGRVKPAGDFNDDGISDFLVGEPNASPFGLLFAGSAYLVYGTAGLGAGGAFDPATLDGANGFMIAGGSSWATIGRRMASLGDFNGDGVSDIALSSISADPPGGSSAGQIYILFGGVGLGASGAVVIPDALTPEVGLVLNGISAGDLAGVSLSPAGDFNGDGVDDIVMSASGVEPEPLAQGQVYLVYGGSDVGNSGVFELADLDGTNGFVVNGPATIFGTSDTQIFGPTGVGDINADGYDDIAVLVGVPVANPGHWIGVIFGGTDVAPDGVLCLEDLNGDDGFRIIRANGGVSTVKVASGTGDVNSDGLDDMFFGLFGVRVLFGTPGVGASGLIAVDDFDGRNGIQIPGGVHQSHAGDVNDDGISDILSGWSVYNDDDCNVGSIGVVFGRRMGDGDLDADVDFADFGAFQACFASELTNTNSEGEPDVPDECHPFDFDKDNTIGLTDFDAFQNAFDTQP